MRRDIISRRDYGLKSTLKSTAKRERKRIARKHKLKEGEERKII